MALSLLLAFTTVTTAVDLQLKGTCDNVLTVWLSEDGNDDHYQEITTGWSGALNVWSQVSSNTLALDSLKGKIKIRCANAANDPNIGGLLFTVGYDGNWYSTDGDNDNNGYYEFVESNSGKGNVMDPGYSWGTSLGVPADWTWTCGQRDDWGCGGASGERFYGEWNDYVFDLQFLDPPTKTPSESPTTPSQAPTGVPTVPTLVPTTGAPTLPSVAPTTGAPTSVTITPTDAPTLPSVAPSREPSASPTRAPHTTKATIAPLTDLHLIIRYKDESWASWYSYRLYQPSDYTDALKEGLDRAFDLLYSHSIMYVNHDWWEDKEWIRAGMIDVNFCRFSDVEPAADIDDECPLYAPEGDEYVAVAVFGVSGNGGLKEYVRFLREAISSQDYYETFDTQMNALLMTESPNLFEVVSIDIEPDDLDRDDAGVVLSAFIQPHLLSLILILFHAL